MKRILLFLTACMLVFSCRPHEYESFSGYAQGGLWQVKCKLGNSKIRPETIKQGLDSLLISIDFSLSGYNKNSVLSRHSRGEKPEYDSLFLDLLRLSESAYRLTEGKLDISSAALYDAWGFGFRNDSLPSDAAVASLRALGASFALYRADGSPQAFNFNSIAQGYSCDILAAYLRAKGVEDMMVNVGGEMYCTGLNPNGQPWRFGIDAPVDGNNTPGASLSRIFTVGPQSCGVVTSGNYRKFYIKDGVKYSHTIDPSLGYPVSHDLLSATVIVDEKCPLVAQGGDFENYPATLADALATYFMVVGRERAENFVTAYEGVEACLIYGDNERPESMQQWASPGFTTVQ